MAQALLHDPEVLIMDEPTSGLDPNQIRGVRQLIRDLGQSKTVLVSTHILQEVEPVADRVLFIHDGKIVFDGKPAAAGQPERKPRAGVLQPDGPAGLKRRQMRPAVDAVDRRARRSVVDSARSDIGELRSDREPTDDRTQVDDRQPPRTSQTADRQTRREDDLR